MTIMFNRLSLDLDTLDPPGLDYAPVPTDNASYNSSGFLASSGNTSGFMTAGNICGNGSNDNSFNRLSVNYSDTIR